MHDGGQMNCPKHVELYSENKFEKLVHLVVFIIRTKIKVLFKTINVLFHTIYDRLRLVIYIK